MSCALILTGMMVEVLRKMLETDIVCFFDSGLYLAIFCPGTCTLMFEWHAFDVESILLTVMTSIVFVLICLCM